ncbi:ABC transporter permease [uncultured Agrococcus sp.]|uniref:ABC transporter permease n=1 Tax=uncultured Agrococcus sp. TaxID=382258 RepID=UPI0025D2AB0C|nr:ABC transporter permease subunit [uncultured Agrococcus sp.]
MTLTHAVVVIVSVAIAVTLGVAAAIFSRRKTRVRAVCLNVTSTFMTIPAMALFGLLIPLLGLGWGPTITALVMYALLPILHNTIAGLDGVDPRVKRAAEGIGLTPVQVFRRVELPLAWPVMLIGIRVTTLMTVSSAAIAAYVNGPGLGGDIFTGLSRIGGAGAINQVLAAVILVVLLGIILDLLLQVLGLLTGARRQRFSRRGAAS